VVGEKTNLFPGATVTVWVAAKTLADWTKAKTVAVEKCIFRECLNQKAEN
jgi:hypothetical protein